MPNHMLKTSANGIVGASKTAPDVSARVKSKFENGFLGGCGSDSQFQSVMQTLPVLPANSNNDRLQRLMASRGVSTDTTLMPSWMRSYAFAPGLGIDALRSRITQTDANAGWDPASGVIAPVVNAGQDRIASGPVVPLGSSANGQGEIQAPVTLIGGEGGDYSKAMVASVANHQAKGKRHQMADAKAGRK